MPWSLITCLLFFLLVVPGLAWPLACRLKLDPAEKLCATIGLSLLAVYLLAFARYLLALPAGAFWTLPVFALAGLAAERRALAVLLGDFEVRTLLLGLLLLSGWCLGWLLFVVSYSGAGWSGDWMEHWQRTRFFLEHWPLEMKFLTLYFLPARPPLANLVAGAPLGATGVNFPAYQMVFVLLNCLAFLPGALLMRRFWRARGPVENAAGQGAVMVFTVLLMLNPSFVQNATFAWTKLFTAFFVLGGLYFFLRSLDADAPRAAAPLCAALLAAGILTHYSTGPYVVVLAVAWLWLHRARWTDAGFWRQTTLLVLIGGAVLITWFGWSFAVYGWHTTLLANSSLDVKDAQSGNQLVKIALNLRDTIVPHFLRPRDEALIAQANRWGYWRDWFFQLYQLNLLFVFGSVAWLVLLRELARGWLQAMPRNRSFWVLFSVGVILLGVAVHGARDTWGLVHICLQPLVVLGLAYLASRWATLGRGWRSALVAGAAVDFCLGLALHFGVQNNLFDRWFAPGRPMAETLASYTISTHVNSFNKTSRGLQFLGDALPLPGVLVLALLAGILTVAIARAARPSR